jgi:hypothetical protein
MESTMRVVDWGSLVGPTIQNSRDLHHLLAGILNGSTCAYQTVKLSRECQYRLFDSAWVTPVSIDQVTFHDRLRIPWTCLVLMQASGESQA